jgi:hypothetical protein
MDDISRRRLRLLAALVPPLLLLGWRVAACPPARLWRDGAAILSIYALFVIAAPESRARKPVTVVVMLFLVGIYAAAQVPLALDYLRQAW